MDLDTAQSSTQMAHQQHWWKESAINADFCLVPPQIRSSVTDLGSRVAAIENEVMSLAAGLHEHDKENWDFQLGLILESGKVCEVQHQNDKGDKTAAINGLIALQAHGSGEVFCGASTEPSWTTTPVAAHYGTDILAMMTDMRPDLIEGVWEARHEKLIARLLQLDRLEDRFDELHSCIVRLQTMTKFRPTQSPFLFPGRYIPSQVLHLHSDCHTLKNQVHMEKHRAWHLAEEYHGEIYRLEEEENVEEDW